MLHYDNDKAANFPFTSHVKVSLELCSRPYLMAMEQYAMAQLSPIAFQVNPNHSVIWPYNGRRNPLPTTGYKIMRKIRRISGSIIRYWVTEARKLLCLGQVTQGHEGGAEWAWDQSGEDNFYIISMLCCTKFFGLCKLSGQCPVFCFPWCKHNYLWACLKMQIAHHPGSRQD